MPRRPRLSDHTMDHNGGLQRTSPIISTHHERNFKSSPRFRVAIMQKSKDFTQALVAALHALGFTELSIFVIMIICIGVSRTTLFR